MGSAQVLICLFVDVIIFKVGLDGFHIQSERNKTRSLTYVLKEIIVNWEENNLRISQINATLQLQYVLTRRDMWSMREYSGENLLYQEVREGSPEEM